MICTDTTMLGFTIVWLFGILCGFGIILAAIAFITLLERRNK